MMNTNILQRTLRVLKGQARHSFQTVSTGIFVYQV